MRSRPKFLLMAYLVCVLIWSGIAAIGLIVINDQYYDDVIASTEH